MKHLIERAVAIRTKADVVAFEDEFIAAVGVKTTRFLGDRPTNWSALSSAVNPRIVLFERVTNMWDAVIEAEARRVRRFDFRTPREAAHKLLHVPLTGPKDMGARERAELARRCRVALLDSDEPIKRPSVLFRDFGIGVTGTEMPQTILSVEGSNKLDKRWLHGLFGKGGSVTAMYSDAIVVVSRKQPSLLASGEEDRVAVAVVRRDHAPDMRLPFFRYLVTADGEPLSVPASEVNFEPGTLVIHVGYQAGKLGEQSWQYEESIYTFAETTLFRPTVPYTLTDERSGKANRRPRTVPTRCSPASVSDSTRSAPTPYTTPAHRWRGSRCPTWGTLGCAGGCSTTRTSAGAASPRATSSSSTPAVRSTTPGTCSASARSCRAETGSPTGWWSR